MLLVYTLIATIVLSIVLANIKSFKKIAVFSYILATVWAVATTVIYYLYPSVMKIETIKTIVTLTERGVIGTAFLIIVMFLGAINPHFKQVGRLHNIRGELSILGFILCLPHFFVYLIEFITTIPQFQKMEVVSLSIFLIYYLLGFWALGIGLPLFFTSFTSYRKKMQAKKWKYLQSFAYLFYASVFGHIILSLINKPDFEEYAVRATIYSLIFFSYTVMRILYGICKKKKIKAVLAHTVALVLLVILTATTIVYAKAYERRVVLEKEQERNRVKKEEEELERKIKKEVDRAKKSKKVTKFRDGRYTSTVQSYNGDMTVGVTIKNDLITDISIQSGDDEEYLDMTRGMQNKIKIQQNTDVEVVSGATVSSVAIIRGVDNCMEKAVRVK